ncbi:hypothetical protein [Paenibacillus residui]|uniref:Glycerophosphoryl diester phosphodiesterase membrane domain-containing protein n=1 Tax=Paenibacillus residui TaxID=629724 RepID=A0ABW3D5R7_9BACL
MGFSDLMRYGKYGLHTLFSSVLFFYRHLSLLILALIPSCIRAYQMWNQLQVPMVFEILVELTRIVLFLLMLCLMTTGNLTSLWRKRFWQRLGDSCSLHLKKNWPCFFLAQIVIFLVFLYGLGNLAIIVIENLSLTPILDILDINSVEHSAQSAYNAYLFFLKNMSVIPLAMVYILIMLGVGPTNHKRLD